MKTVAKLIAAVQSVHEFFVINWPGPVGKRLRYRHYKRKLKHLGKGVVIDAGVQILSPEWVSIGDNTWIDHYVIILGGPPGKGSYKITRKPNSSYRGGEGEVHIGSNCHIAPYCLLSGHGGLWLGDNSGVGAGSQIYSYSHHFRDLSNPDQNDTTVYKYSAMVAPEEQALIASPVVFEDNTAVGANSIVLPGSTIGEGSWLGSCSLLRGSIAPGFIASGTPAKVVKERFAGAPANPAGKGQTT